MDIVLSYDADELFNMDCRPFGQVSFELQSTLELDTIADGIRQQKGYIPFFDESGDDIWDNGWYDFYLEVDVFKRTATSLICDVCGNDADEEICPDNRKYYRIEEYINVDFENLTEQLVAELRKRHHTSLDEIEKEVRGYV